MTTLPTRSVPAGRPEWRFDVEVPVDLAPEPPVVVDGIPVLRGVTMPVRASDPTHHAVLHAFDPQDGGTRFRVEAPEGVLEAFGPVRDGDGLLAVTKAPGRATGKRLRVRRLALDGRELREQEIERAANSYVALQSLHPLPAGFVLEEQRSTGAATSCFAWGEAAPRWERPGRLAAASADVVVVQARLDPRFPRQDALVGLHAVSGEARWTYPDASGDWDPISDGETVVLYHPVDDRGHLEQPWSLVRAYALADGAVRWERPIAGFLQPGRGAARALIATDVDGAARLHLVTPGGLLDGRPFEPPLVAFDAQFLVRVASGELVCEPVSDPGAIAWRLPLPAPFSDGLRAVAADGLLYLRARRRLAALGPP